MSIRRALAADAETVGRIHVESWNVAYRGIMPDDVIARTEVRYRIRLNRVLKDRLGKDTRP
ncbi:MAG TPA: hypothetical protein VEK77_10165 [Gemmatimonadales bacterium]|nr:hypothetical protein [Gemmatimonadales bacterium]